MVEGEELAMAVGATIGFNLLLSVFTLGAMVAGFWLLNQTQFFAVQIQPFMDKYALPLVLSLTGVRLLETLLERLGALAQ